jgi:adenylate cyclase
MTNVKRGPTRTKVSANAQPPRDVLLTVETRLALVTETVTEGIYDWNVAANALWVSDRLKVILGISEARSISESWADRVHPEDMAGYKAAIIAHFKGETERLACEYRIRRGTGDYFWIADSGRCIRGEDGRAVRLIGAIRDITRRKLAELKLIAASQAADKARQQLNDALEAMSEGLVLFDAEDRIVICNSNYRRYFAVAGGQEVAAMVKPGALLWDIMRAAHEKGMFPLIKGTDIEAHITRRKALRQNLQGGTVEQNLSDGRWLQINEHQTADGGTASVYTDITDVKRREAELARKTEMLESLSSKLAKYLPQQVYKSIFTGERSVEVAPSRKKLTIFFSDIAEFSNTVEELEAEELTSLLNQYLTEMSKIALAHGATVDKFIGDAIVAFFGDPVSRGPQDDAIACVRMAITMQQRMRELQSEWRGRGLERAFELRMGITTGYCTVGNFGSEDRLDYTVIGNAVNLAARLQQNAERGAILMDNETNSLVQGTISTEEQGSIQVRGFSRPVRIFSVTGQHDDPLSGPISINRDGVRVWIDRSKISDAAKQEAVAALRTAIARLSD